MLNIQDLMRGFQSADNRPIIVWTGTGDNNRFGINYRIVLSQKNTLIVEIQEGKDAMGQLIWNKNSDYQVDKEILAKVLLDTLKELSNIKIVE